MNTEPILTIENLSTGYSEAGQSKTLSRCISATLTPGTLTFIAGPNGCGKSTLIKTLCGFHTPLEGQIFYGEQPLETLSIKEQAGYRAIVLPHNQETGHLKVKTLIELGIESGRMTGSYKRKSHRDDIEEQLSLVGMSAFIDRSFSTLSDGEKQKIQIVRALCQRPRLLVLDEPTAFLDAAARIEILGILKKISTTRKMSVLFSSHDLLSALNATHRCWILSKEGEFQEFQSSEINEEELLTYFK